MLISVVVPTYNRRGLLRRCLDSLVEQNFPKDDYEIIVVDDGSTDGTRDVVEMFKSSGNVRYFRQENRGPAASRNLGIREARGMIIAFLDSDCVATEDWLVYVSKSHDRYPTGVGAIGGPTIADDECGFIARLSQNIINYFVEKHRIGSDVLFLPACNMSVRKEVFERVGYFDEEFKHAAGEDTEMCWGMIRKGYRLAWEPMMRVRHLQRNDVVSFLRQHFNYGRNIIRVRKKHPDLFNRKRGIFPVLGTYLDEIFISPPRIAMYFPGIRDRLAAIPLVLLRQLAYFIGMVKGRFEYG